MRGLGISRSCAAELALLLIIQLPAIAPPQPTLSAAGALSASRQRFKGKPLNAMSPLIAACGGRAARHRLRCRCLTAEPSGLQGYLAGGAGEVGGDKIKALRSKATS